MAVVLAWSLLAAWATFLGMTAIVFLLAFRSIFPKSMRDETNLQQKSETTITFMMRELESTIAKGFEDKDLQAQRKTFEALARIFGRKVRRKYGMGEVELKVLIRNPTKLEATVREPELVQLLSDKVKPNLELWDITRLSNLISKVEDWSG